ncbi:MAG TPA: hypothetical protein VJ464_28580 [Blastocatellia bacterium]|nr:hypothetical protein [Blastocatellia bacterium]
MAAEEKKLELELEKQPSERRKEINGIITTETGLIGTILGIWYASIPSAVKYIGVGVITFFVILIGYRALRNPTATYKKIHTWFDNLRPLFVVIGLGLIILIYFNVRQSLHQIDGISENDHKKLEDIYNLGQQIHEAVQPSEKISRILFNKAPGGLYNSWDNNSLLQHYIQVEGEIGTSMWVYDPDGAAHFSYHVNKGIRQNDANASSGGYLTFYSSPCDRLTYHEFSFACKAEVAKGECYPDVGIRLAVDDPRNPYIPNRERVTYEISSLNEYYKGKLHIDENWHTFTVNLGDFQQMRYQFVEGLDGNALNKIVFFVSNNQVIKCPKGKLWFRDVKFSSGKP